MIRFADIPPPAPPIRRVTLKAKAETKKRGETKRGETKNRGRPRKAETDKPWIAAGVSRATYYRSKPRP